MSTDFLVKLRDAAQMMLDAANMQLSQSVSVDSMDVCLYDPNKIGWVRTEGPKGPYERYPAFQQKPSQTIDYLNLINDLKDHEGKMVLGGLFYWLWDDGETIGRKAHKMK